MTQRIFSLGRESLCLLHGTCPDWLVLEVTRLFRALEYDLQQWLHSNENQHVAVKLAPEVSEGKPLVSDGVGAEGTPPPWGGRRHWTPGFAQIPFQAEDGSWLLSDLVRQSRFVG